jgi:hypothetical protein
MDGDHEGNNNNHPGSAEGGGGDSPYQQHMGSSGGPDHLNYSQEMEAKTKSLADVKRRRKE